VEVLLKAGASVNSINDEVGSYPYIVFEGICMVCKNDTRFDVMISLILQLYDNSLNPHGNAAAVVTVLFFGFLSLTKITLIHRATLPYMRPAEGATSTS
jgi:hypothetical protein